MMLLNPYRFAPAAGGTHVTDGLVFMLDPESYSSGQVWGDAPYDFNLGSDSGADGADPTHNGTYWTFDGGDYFTAASAATAFIKNMHKAGAEFTIEAWWYYNGGGSNVHPIFDSGTSDQSGSDMSRGVIFGDMGVIAPPAAGSFGFRVKQDSGGGTSFSVHLTTPLTTGWHHLTISYQQGAGSFLWVDGAPASTNLGSTWDGTLSSPGTTDPASPARIGARGDGTFRVASGSRIGTLRVYDRALSQSELLQNWNAERATYGL